MADKLSKADVARLLDDPSAGNRESTARKVASEFGGGKLSGSERKIAEEIFALMVRDAEVRVRAALSTNLKDCEFLSHDIAKSLAADVDEVSLPMLQFSSVLTDDDLIEIVRNHGQSKQKAVAKRERLSETVADALVDTGDEEVVATLVSNDSAEISEPTLQRVVDEFGTIEKVNEPLTMRSKLPVTVAERLVNLVSERLRDHLMTKHELPPEQISDLILQSRERATLGLLSPNADTTDVVDLVSQLYASGRLTPTIILRAVCLGDMRFFEAALATLARVSLKNALKLIHDSSGLGLPAILAKAKMPKALHPAFRAAVEIANETEFDGGENDRMRFRKRMIERVLTYMEDPQAGFGEENIEYLIAKLQQIDPEIAPAA